MDKTGGATGLGVKIKSSALNMLSLRCLLQRMSRQLDMGIWISEDKSTLEAWVWSLYQGIDVKYYSWECLKSESKRRPEALQTLAFRNKEGQSRRLRRSGQGGRRKTSRKTYFKERVISLVWYRWQVQEDEGLDWPLILALTGQWMELINSSFPEVR